MDIIFCRAVKVTRLTRLVWPRLHMLRPMSVAAQSRMSFTYAYHLCGVKHISAGTSGEQKQLQVCISTTIV